MAVTYFEIDGGKLALEIEGEGPLVICSPAMGDTRDAYGPLASQLVAAGYRVVRVDLRGHGDSTTTFKSYGDEAVANDFLALIKAYGGGKPAVLVGASISAAGATIAAGREPDLVAGVVLLGAFLRSPSGGAIIRQIMRLMLLRPWGPAIWRTYSKSLWPGLGAEGTNARAVSTVDLLTRPNHWAAFQATVAGANHDVVTPWLESAGKAAPALVVFGTSDPDWTDPVAEGKWVASVFADSEFLSVDGVGHAPMLEKPDVVGPAVIQFLQRIKYSA
ncbi:putative hydrolase [Xylariales sp. PMI_506]|nr:putative hydrolase [Xylariales sp. PMI_506]